jgi:hypothetical protein
MRSVLIGSLAALTEHDAATQRMLQYQEAMQKYNRMMTMLSNLLQMQHETTKAIVRNLRG